MGPSKWLWVKETARVAARLAGSELASSVLCFIAHRGFFFAAPMSISTSSKKLLLKISFKGHLKISGVDLIFSSIYSLKQHIISGETQKPYL
jgi:hypothetical protein